MDPGNLNVNNGSWQSGSAGCRSPAHSYMTMKSDRSMGLPDDFKKDVPFPDDSWIQKESSDCPSPSWVSMKSDKSKDSVINFKRQFRSPELSWQSFSKHSYMSLKSDQSMGLPDDFQKDVPFPDDSWIQKESSDCPSPSCVSMKSDKSKDSVINFKRQFRSPELSEFSSRLLTADHVRCYVCFSLLRDPVSIPCGHSYCEDCINDYWSQPGPAGDYVCLHCEKSYPVRPELSVNVAFNWMLQALQQTGFSPACPTLPQAAPGDVACDICSSKTHRAIKTCLTCNVSYCEKHLGQHYTVRAMQKHTLVHVNEYTRHWGRMDEIKEEPIVDSESEEHQEIAGKRRKKSRQRMAVEKDEMFQQASTPAVDLDDCSVIRRRTPDTFKPTTCALIPKRMFPAALPPGPMSANVFSVPQIADLSHSQPFPHTHSQTYTHNLDLDSNPGQLYPTAEYWDSPLFSFDQPEDDTEALPGISGSDPPSCPSPFQEFQLQ